MDVQIIRDKVEETPKQESQSPLFAASPPSSSSSPAHEFSFTISLQPPPTAIHDKSKPPPPPPPFTAMDLSPADDIFFHGHLLPLQFLSHLPVSPRSSTNSLDSFTLPITELLLDDDQIISADNSNDNENAKFDGSIDTSEIKNRAKSKSFSIFGLPKWRKGCEVRETQKKKFKFDVSDVVKRYMKMVRPLLSFRGSSRRSMNHNNKKFHHQPYSFSGSLSSIKEREDQFRGIRMFSAPASMRTSPTNSGILLATSGATSSSSSESTMEELQAAIQAAITHCKNSIAVEEKIKSQDK